MELTNRPVESTSKIPAWTSRLPAAPALAPHLDTILKAAILAPSGYNSQPWTFELIDSDQIIIRPDWKRTRPAVDPDHRELFLSIGAVVANMEIAAAHTGYQTIVTPVEAAGTLDGIRVTLVKNDSAVSRLSMRALRYRRTTRALYNGESIKPSRLAELEQIATEPGIRVSFLDAKTTAKQFEMLYQQAHTEQLGNPAFLAEFMKWSRFDVRNTELSVDGLMPDSVRVPKLRSGKGRRFLNQFMTPELQAAKDLAALASASHVAVITADISDRSHWIAAGQTMERLQIAATQLHVSSSYHNAVCQARCSGAELAKLIGQTGRFPLVVLRFGYGPDTMAPARRPLREFLKR